jgi:hypothetical protein
VNYKSRPKAALESVLTTATTDAIVIERADSPRHWTRWIGCPRGCGYFHEPPCSAGRPIGELLAGAA